MSAMTPDQDAEVAFANLIMLRGVRAFSLRDHTASLFRQQLSSAGMTAQSAHAWLASQVRQAAELEEIDRLIAVEGYKMMNGTDAAPPHPGWIEVSSQTASYLRGAGLDGIAVETVPPNDNSGTPFAPAWAEAICSVEGISQRMKMCALKKAARDPGVAQIVTTLVLCIDPEDRKELVEQLGQEFMQTLVCKCGMKFDSATTWRNHVEFECKARGKALDKL